jgi:hypothetical protein
MHGGLKCSGVTEICFSDFRRLLIRVHPRSSAFIGGKLIGSKILGSDDGDDARFRRFPDCLRASVVGFVFPDPRSSVFIRGKVCF